MTDYTAERLAIEGGRPHCKTLLPKWPEFDAEQISAVTDVLESGRVNYWTSDACRLFEEEYAASLGTGHAICLANGTLALELAMHAIGLQPGDEVIVPAHTFVATASAVLMQRGIPVFADIDPESQNITAETIEAVLTHRTKAIIPVHMAGRPCRMDEIIDLAQRRGLRVIEDCAQAHGAKFQDRPIGSWGDMAAFSFCQDKIITTGGEGGLLVTNDEKLYEKAWAFKDHGKSRNKIRNGVNNGLFRYLHDTVGTNWRMTAMQAAIGRIALKRLPGWIERRRAHAAHYIHRLLQHPAVHVAAVPEDTFHSYYKFYFHLDANELYPGWSRNFVVQAAQKEGIPCGTGSCAEIYQEELFQNAGLPACEVLPCARSFGERSMMLPLHPTLHSADIDLIAETMLKVLDVACSRAPLMEKQRLRAA